MINPKSRLEPVAAKASASVAPAPTAARGRKPLAALLLTAGLLLAGARVPSLVRSLWPQEQTLVLTAADRAVEFSQSARQKALAGQPIPGLATASQAFLNQVKAGRVEFYAVRVFDSHDEDRDVVSLGLGSAGTRGPIVTTNSGQKEFIPSVDGQPPVVTIHAVRDGSGIDRVSVGLETTSGEWTSRIMPEGSTQPVRLAIGR